MDAASVFSITYNLVAGNAPLALVFLLSCVALWLFRERARLIKLVEDKDSLVQANFDKIQDIYKQTLEEILDEGKAGRELFSDAMAMFERLTAEVLKKIK